VSVRDLRGTVAALVAPTRTNAFCFALFAVAACGYAYFVLHAFDGAIVHAASRDPVSGEVGAEVFLGYGGKANLVVVLNALLFGWPVHLPWGSRTDNSVYIGLVPLVGLAIAVVRERSREARCFNHRVPVSCTCQPQARVPHRSEDERTCVGRTRMLFVGLCTKGAHD
jgi:hypothetical protein